ncbi:MULTISPECIES: FRG domain-containing protein [unclassified Amycolatopsis]|uniref:FRG domain-containing protein n=1 Tax=unclassified Amycolatopsis TaxID=2618356 RepID=UPI002876E49F|nr:MULTISPECIES: FRG domain-containing protein [unclassified Amycolatopsis]MDS0134660.1 FRG domain-containing protein [Amycolatopsis sp. 505]MDS0147441.1 FRG domain-containing protein [Amycolatopsis sp. CM201R]
MRPPTFKNWLADGWGIKVETPHQLLKLISRIALLAQDRTYAWRGQNDAAWDFSASLFREIRGTGEEVTEERIRSRELDILTEARRWGLGRDLGPSATDMHMLAVLQHHGVPTRLIDVTANPMTALWFATEQQESHEDGKVPKSDGVLFAIDVTKTPWYETFQHGARTWGDMSNPLGSAYEEALKKSAADRQMFRAFPALPDERMKAQEGFFLGCAVPKQHKAPGVMGLNPMGPAPGADKLSKLLSTESGPGRPASLPFCAIVIPATVKDKLRDPLKRTYNRRRRVLFPDVDGFREGLRRGQLD